jgi:katanin p60 ATPase-containing subunit A1
MGDTLTEINENTKMARETALFGQYDTSLVYYQGVIQQIQKYLSAIKDPDKRRKWLQVTEHAVYRIYVIKCLVFVEHLP